MSGPIVLATDLDGTFAHGTSAGRKRLQRWLAEHPDATLIYVTGRTVKGVRKLAERLPLPTPDVLVADVGTSVLRGLGPERVDAIEAELGSAWPGADAVRERLAPLAELTLQELEAPRRASYWVEPVRQRRAPTPPGVDPFAARPATDPSMDAEAERLAAAVAARAREALEGLEVDVIVSANVYLDVLPRGVNKGTTLRRVLAWLGALEEACVVAGDSLNDLALFQTGLRGVAVGNCEPALRRELEGLEGVFMAEGEGVDGILEGLLHHGHTIPAERVGGTDGQ